MKTYKYFLAATLAAALLGAGCGNEQSDFTMQGNNDQPALVQQQATTTQPVEQQAANNAPVIAPLSKESCEAAGSRWNACASACEGAASGTLCIESCVERCECGGPQHGQCPKDYACMSHEASSTADSVGVCLQQLGARPAEPPEYYHDDKTSVVLPIGKTLYNPFIVQGTSTAAFENTMNWRLKEEDGKIIAKGLVQVKSQEMGQPGPFEVIGWFDEVPNSARGTLEIYDVSAQDGSETYNFPMNVNLTDLRTEVYPFFSNKTDDPEMKDCGKVEPAKHIAVGPLSLGLAMHELLRGPNAADREQGFFSSLPENVDHPQITGEAGTIRLNFDQSLQNGVAGSCRVSAIRAELEQTVKALAGQDVKVEIAVDGKTEEVLQP